MLSVENMSLRTQRFFIIYRNEKPRKDVYIYIFVDDEMHCNFIHDIALDSIKFNAIF